MDYQTSRAVEKAAIATGMLRDESYNTVRHGRIESWTGQVTVWYQGLPYLVEGYGPRGDERVIDGGIRITLHPGYVFAYPCVVSVMQRNEVLICLKEEVHDIPTSLRCQEHPLAWPLDAQNFVEDETEWPENGPDRFVEAKLYPGFGWMAETEKAV